MPIAQDVVLGERVVIFHRELVKLYGCRLGDDTKIGAFVEIQKMRRSVSGARSTWACFSTTSTCYGISLSTICRSWTTCSRSSRPVSQRPGWAHVPGEPENIAYTTMVFAGPLIGHLHVNWLGPVKVRRTLLGGSRRIVVFDDLETSEKLRV